MDKSKSNITITARLYHKEFELRTYEGEYDNLMTLLYDRLYPDEFGECKGIGRCGTCHIVLLNPSDELLKRDRNESTTLSKRGVQTENSRLACQILINKSINGLHVSVDL